jgi:hypothetical protein
MFISYIETFYKYWLNSHVNAHSHNFPTLFLNKPTPFSAAASAVT